MKPIWNRLKQFFISVVASFKGLVKFVGGLITLLLLLGVYVAIMCVALILAGPLFLIIMVFMAFVSLFGFLVVFPKYSKLKKELKDFANSHEFKDLKEFAKTEEAVKATEASETINASYTVIELEALRDLRQGKDCCD